MVSEWKVVFTQTSVTVTRPDGDKFTGTVSIVGKFLTIDPQDGPLKGKKIQTLWYLAFGPETKLLTWAWGVPSGNSPTSFESAMTEANNAEFALTSCLKGKDTKVCNFDH